MMCINNSSLLLHNVPHGYLKGSIIYIQQQTMHQVVACKRFKAKKITKPTPSKVVMVIVAYERLPSLRKFWCFKKVVTYGRWLNMGVWLYYYCQIPLATCTIQRNKQTNLSSSLISVSTSNVYIKPEQPPPSTETRRKLSLSSANILWSCYNTINNMLSSVPHNCKLCSGIL